MTKLEFSKRMIGSVFDSMRRTAPVAPGMTESLLPKYLHILDVSELAILAAHSMAEMAEEAANGLPVDGLESDQSPHGAN